jgi:hypothetical protein
MQGFSLDGYFAEYAVVDAREAMVLPQGCLFDQTCDIWDLTNVCYSGSEVGSAIVLRRSYSLSRRRRLRTRAWPVDGYHRLRWVGPSRSPIRQVGAKLETVFSMLTQS